MNNDDELRHKTADIAARYIARTVDEVVSLRQLLTQLPSDGKAVLKQIEMLTHRIRGSGAVFGFDGVSDAAGVIESLAIEMESKDRYDTSQLTAQLLSAITTLADEVQRALILSKNKIL